MKYIPLVILLLNCFSARAQYNPKDYGAFDGKKQLVFADSFNNDSRGWLLEDSVYVATTTCDVNRDNYIKDGILNIHAMDLRRRQFMAIDINMHIDFNKNFEISFKAHIKGKAKRKNYGVIYWGARVRDSTHIRVNGYHVYFNNEGIIRIMHLDGKFKNQLNPDVYREFQSLSDLSKLPYNIYKIRKCNDRYYLFVNGHYFGSVQAVSLLSNCLGVGVSSHNVGVFDDIEISYLPE